LNFSEQVCFEQTSKSFFGIVLVPRYKLSLCHTGIKPDLLGFLGI